MECKRTRFAFHTEILSSLDTNTGETRIFYADYSRSTTKMQDIHPVDLYRIHSDDRAIYTNVNDVIKHIESKLQEYVIEGGTQYIAITNVTNKSFQEFNKKREQIRPHSPRVRFFREQETMIIKFRDNIHATVEGMLHNAFLTKLTELGIEEKVLMSVGAAMQSLPELKIQPDLSYLPYQTRTLNEYPSFVVGVGDMDCLHRLQLDTRLWLENSHGTKVALLMAICTESKELLFEVWQSKDNTVECVQHIRVNNTANEATDAPLSLSLGLLFDELPVIPGLTLESSISLSAQDLGKFEKDIFSYMVVNRQK